MRLSATGDWPGPVVLRRGWARADARPWNDDVPDAQLRLMRGSGEFLRACTHFLLTKGAPAVASPPLPDGAAHPWKAAGYSPYLSLQLLRRELAGPLPSVGRRVQPGGPADWEEVLAVDHAAFESLWRMDRNGLQEAMAATARSALLVARQPQQHDLAGFALVGRAGTIGYLQRLAVHPDHQGAGLGRALVRAGLRWAREAGSKLVLLNTQPGNRPAIALYESEGFRVLPDRLRVLRTGAERGT